jgi:diguanylate cyclase (GGDEF)-like protein/hemerythrin-like metal-binding protein
VSLEDITQRVEMEQQVRELAFFDPLTHLPNRRLALERLTQQLVRARRSRSILALLFIDLDKFKPINDELGHTMGDWVLQAVAQRILGCLRESDTAARIGGDEFVVLLPDLQSADDAVRVAEKIRNAIEQEFVAPHGAVLNITSSIGVALYPEHGETEKDLMRLGDEAMYHAKRSGGNAIHLCVPTVLPGQNAKAEIDAKSHPYVHLRWKPAFLSGHPVIDQEHEALFFLANRLLDKVALRRQQPLEFEAAFSALYAQTEEHFAHEEAILQTYGYVDLAHHAKQHQAFLLRARTLHLQLQLHDVDAERELVKFLVSELVVGHLMHEDRAFFDLFTPKPESDGQLQT